MNLTPMNHTLYKFALPFGLAHYLMLFGLYSIIFTVGCDSQSAKSYNLDTSNNDASDASHDQGRNGMDSELSLDLMLNDMSVIADHSVSDLDMEEPLERLAMPAPNERAFIETSNGLILAWRVEQQLYRVHVTKEELDGREDLLIARASPWFDLPEEYHSSTIKLSALASSPPYFLLSAEAQESVALRADHSNPEVIRLGLQGDLLFAVGDGGAIVLARLWEEPVLPEPMEEMSDQELSSTSNKSKVLAWQFVRDGEWSGLQEDQLGIPHVSSLTRGLGSWVLATDQGQCFMLNEQVGLNHAWYCHSQTNSTLLGDDFEIKVFGELNRSADDAPRGSGLWLWSGTPGRNMDPLQSNVQIQSEYGSERLLPNEALSIKDGSLERWLIKSQSPQVLVSVDESEWSIVTSQGEYNFEDPTAQNIFGLMQVNSPQPQLIIWDEIEAALSIKRLTQNEWIPFNLPSVAPEDELCLVSPERCDMIDHDCDGQSQNQLCCVQGESVSSRLSDVLFPKYNWFTGDSEIGALAMIASQNAARLFSFSTSGGEATLRAQWNNIESIGHFSNYLSLVAAIGKDSDGQSYLLQNRRVNDEWLKLTLPCSALALSVLDANHTTRVYCEDKALVFSTDSEAAVEESYPEDSNVNWMTTWKTEVENLGESYWLVSVGEYNQLSLWKGDLDSITLGESETLSLPNTLGSLTPSDRSIPIQLPAQGLGLISRIVESARVEVWIDEVGWTELGGHRWPLWATLSANEAIAFSVGYDEDPAEVQDSFLQRVNVRIHSLHKESVYFGELIKEQISKDSFGGVHLANYDSQNGTRPNLINLTAGSLELSNAVCSE